MKKGQVLQGTVAYVDFPNKGVVKVEEGKQVIVKNALPGQEISFSDRKSTRLNSSHEIPSRMPSSA